MPPTNSNVSVKKYIPVNVMKPLYYLEYLYQITPQSTRFQ